MSTSAPEPSLAVSIIGLVGDLAWPLAILVIVFVFHADIRSLLKKLAMANSVKFGPAEFTFQEHTEKSIGARAPIEAPLETGPDGFLTAGALKTAIVQAGLVADKAMIRALLQIFQTPEQRTWLAVSDDLLFVLLDDESTRRKNNIVQDMFEKTKALPLEFDTDISSASVKFAANKTWWYYSLQLFPTTASLQKAVRNLVKRPRGVESAA